MKKIYLLKFLLFTFYAFAQPKLFVGNNGKFRVSPGTLVYAGGGVKMVGSGKIDNSGNFMIVGNTADKFETVDVANNVKSDGENFVLRLNDITNYTTSTYGQLYIKGLLQTNITGVVDKQYKTLKHGTYQQMALPFYGKTFHSLGLELITTPEPAGTTFNNTRYSQNEVLQYNNSLVVSENVDVYSTITSPATYFQVGASKFDPSVKDSFVKGRPYSDEATQFINGFPLTGAGAAVTFGTYGDKLNKYREPYYSYILDVFDYSSSFDVNTYEWKDNFGKNIYQFGNPFLTNLDLASLTADNTIGQRIQGIRYEVSGVQKTSYGSFASGFKYVTFNNGVPTGDINGLVIKPMETFVIKMLDNYADSPKIFFNPLRSFKSTPRTSGTNTVTSASIETSNIRKMAALTSGRSGGTVKQLGVIALDDKNSELGRTYFILSPTAKTGHNSEAKSQITAQNTHLIGTFEELPTGDYDPVAAQVYWLYINEANDIDFKGKPLPMYLYDSDKLVVKFKFEILENGTSIEPGRSLLSEGESFYIAELSSNKLVKVANEATFNVSGDAFGLFYGVPEATLNANEHIKPNLTQIVFDDNEKTFKVFFDPKWKTADVLIYDLSGRLIKSETKVNTKNIYKIIVNSNVNQTYVIKLVSEFGEIITRKIIK